VESEDEAYRPSTVKDLARTDAIYHSAESSSSDHIAMRGTFSEGVIVPLNMPVVLRGIETESWFTLAHARDTASDS